MSFASAEFGYLDDSDPVTANSIRLNWNPSWGKDPGRPETVVATCWDA